MVTMKHTLTMKHTSTNATVEPTERWAVIDECPDYEVSDQGRVRRVDNHRLVSTGGRSRGYPLAGLSRPDGVRVGRTVHRLVAKAFVPGYAPGLQVNHINGVKTDNRAVNLEWVTPDENIAHAKRLGLFKAGAANAHAQAVEELNERGEVINRWPTVAACVQALGSFQATVSAACSSWVDGRPRRLVNGHILRRAVRTGDDVVE